MASFADKFTIKLGDQTVVGRRLTIREVKENAVKFLADRLDVEGCAELIASHCELVGGEKFDPLDLTEGQLRKLIGELVLPEKGRTVSDFIGLFS